MEGRWLPPQAPGGDDPDEPVEPVSTGPAPGAAAGAAQPFTPPAGAAQPSTPPGGPAPPPAQAPPGYGAPGWYGPPPGWTPAPPEPGNGQAVAGFVLGISALALLFLTAGFGAPLTIVCGILAIVFGVQGKRRVDRGETPKHRGLAQAGVIMGIVSIVLSLLAIAALIALFAADPDWLDEELDKQYDFEARALLRVGAALASLLA